MLNCSAMPNPVEVDRKTSGDEEYFLECPQPVVYSYGLVEGKTDLVYDAPHHEEDSVTRSLGQPEKNTGNHSRIKDPFKRLKSEDLKYKCDKNVESTKQSVFGRLSANISRPIRKSTPDDDDFERTLDNIANRMSIDDCNSESVDHNLGYEKNVLTRSSVSKIKQLSEVTGKIGQLGRAAKSRLSMLSHGHNLEKTNDTYSVNNKAAVALVQMPSGIPSSSPLEISSSAQPISRGEDNDGLKLWLTDERPVAMRRPSEFLEFEISITTSSDNSIGNIATSALNNSSCGPQSSIRHKRIDENEFSKQPWGIAVTQGNIGREEHHNSGQHKSSSQQTLSE